MGPVLPASDMLSFRGSPWQRKINLMFSSPHLCSGAVVNLRRAVLTPAQSTIDRCKSGITGRACRG